MSEFNCYIPCRELIGYLPLLSGTAYDPSLTVPSGNYLNIDNLRPHPPGIYLYGIVLYASCSYAFQITSIMGGELGREIRESILY